MVNNFIDLRKRMNTKLIYMRGNNIKKNLHIGGEYMKKKLYKLTAWLLTLVMIITFIPDFSMIVFAKEEVKVVCINTTIFAYGTPLLITGYSTRTKTYTTIYIDSNKNGVVDEGELSLAQAGIANAPEDNYTKGELITIYGGACEENFKGDTYIVMTGGKVDTIYGGNSVEIGGSAGVFEGNSYIKITGGKINSKIAGGNLNISSSSVAEFKGTSTVIFAEDAENIGSISIYGRSTRDEKFNGTSTGIILNYIVEPSKLDTFNNGVFKTSDTSYETKGTCTVPADIDLVIPEGATFTVKAGTNITIDGKLENNGTVIIEEGATLTTSSSSTFTNNGVVTNNGTLTTNGTLICNSHDFVDKICKLCGDEQHFHSWSYTKTNETITATCTAKGCTDTDGGSVTIKKPESLTYTGEAIEAVVTNTLTTGESVSVVYSGEGLVNGKPLKLGNYNASITVDGKKIEVNYEITGISINYATVNVLDVTYKGEEQKPEVTVELKGKTLIKDTDYTVEYINNTNAGSATVTITGIGNYKGEVKKTFTVNTATLTNVTVKQNGTLTYNGNGQIAAVSTNGISVNTQPITFTYSKSENGTYGDSIPEFTDAGEHTVWFKASAPNHSDYIDSFTVKIEKAEVEPPTLESKHFSGILQKATVPESDLYTVDSNNGGSESGAYDVVLRLKDNKNYKWSTTENETVTVKFDIIATENSWITNPSINSWTYGQDAKEPVYESKFGTVKINYTGTAFDGSTWNSENEPTKAGDYTVTFTVDATDDYSSLSKSVNFTIAKSPVTVTAENLAKTYGDSDPEKFTWKVTSGTVAEGDNLNININRESGENSNIYEIKVSQSDGANPNYDITFVPGKFTINKATLTVSADNKTIKYGDIVPEYTINYSGWKFDDNEDSLSGELKFTCDYAQFSDKGNYSIKASGYESDNYEFNYVDGNLTVCPKPITVIIVNKTGIYGENILPLSATDNGIVNNDTNVYKVTTTATSSSSVGKYDITGTSLDDNYDITFENEVSAYEITARELTVNVVVDNKQYDGKNTASISSAILNNIVTKDVGKIMLVNGTATFETVNVGDSIRIALTDFTLTGDAEVLKNYTLKQPIGIKANIINHWDPVKDTEYSVSVANDNGWLNTDFEITAKEGFELSLTNTASGEWVSNLIGSTEGADSNITFYVRNKKTGAISLAKTERYKLDKNTEDTGTIGKVYFDERNSWEKFINSITFGLFYKTEVTVKAEATDALSGTERIEYVESTTALSETEVKALTTWKEMPKNGVDASLEDTKQFIYYIRITDKAGNVSYLSTDGAEYDTTDPAVSGIENGKTYYTTQKVTVTDNNLSSVTVNGTPFDFKDNLILLEGNKDASYTIMASDKAGNSITVTVNMAKISDITDVMADKTKDNVTSDDKQNLQTIVDKCTELLKDEDMSADERTELEKTKADVEAMIAVIGVAADAANTDNTSKVENITSKNVTPDSKNHLEDAKADLNKALKENRGNYTEEEKKVIEEKIKCIDEALAVLANVEGVESKINVLPEMVVPDDEEVVQEVVEAKIAYDSLTQYEKTLVSADTKAKIKLLTTSIVTYNIINGDKSSWIQGSDIGLSFTANGAYRKFVGIKVDGKEVEKTNYEAKSGSTIITLKASYLDRLSAGEHTITVIYTDGETNGTFKVISKVQTPTSPETNDNSNIWMWSAVLFVSLSEIFIILFARGRKIKSEEK